jgi:type I restriction enzyme, S subunit
MTTANGWPVVRLGEVVSHRKEFIRIDDLMTYKRCRVQLHAQGVLLRDEIVGAFIKTKSQQVCRTDEFLVAEIDAKLGGFGIVPASLEGAVVSNHYFLFVPNRSHLEPEFLRYYSMTPTFREQVNARGSTNYAAIRPAHVMGYSIPLPSLEEQRRIVERISRLAGKIELVRQRVQHIQSRCRAFLRSMFSNITIAAPYRKMGEVAPLIRRKAEPRLGEEYPELGVRSFDKGTFHKPPLDFLLVGSKKLYRIQPGDLIFNNVFAWEGAIAVAQPEDEGRFGSHRFITCVPHESLATAEFLCFYFSTPEGLERIGSASPGGAGRNRTLGLDKLAEIEVPVPPLEHQLRFERLLKKVRATQGSRNTASKKSNAFIPSILDRAFRGAL